MTPRIGDIVTIRTRPEGHEWVAAPAGSHSPTGDPYVRLIRPGEPYNEAFTTYLSSCEFSRRPEYAEGQRVRVGSHEGTILSLTDAEATIRLDAYRRPLEGGGHLAMPVGRTIVPLWALTLENQQL